MIGLSMGPSVMMQLGAFQFSISTAAYQELTRRSEYRWASQERFGKEPNLQFTGPATEAISLAGIIYPDYKGGAGQLDKMRTLAGGGQPLNLVGGAGKTLGRWVIESLEEKQSTFAAAGAPRKQEFTLQLKKFPDPPKAAPDTSSKASGASTSKSAIGSFADKSMASIGSAVSSMTSTLESVQAKAAEIGNAVGPVIATVQNGIRTTKELQAQVRNLKAASKNLNSLENVQSAVYGVMSSASAASNACSMASNAANQLGININQPTTDPGAVTAVRDCTASCSRSAVASTRVHADAAAINRTLGA